jgi:murein DD-endopeptidase MepM/ murein hydrolase activator NlpD
MKKKRSQFFFVKSSSSRIKEFTISLPKILFFAILILIVCFFSLKYSIDFIIDFSQNSKISHLKKENDFLQKQLTYMSANLTSLRTKITEIEKIDDEVRSLINLPVLGPDVRQVGVGGGNPGMETSSNSEQYSFNSEISSSMDLLEKLEREIKLEKTSYEELLVTLKKREDSLQYLPVLKPVPNARLTDGFGNRRHPILKLIRFHPGVDLAADKGTPIIAPADGYVKYAGRYGGYGNFVKINHKYGYETYYGHLHKIYVRPGQYIKRGDKIGEVGSTGLSTSNHLHYEVHYHGKAINPIQFFLNDVVYY